MSESLAAPPPSRAAVGWKFHAQRDRLLAEAHARPATPLPAPALATRIAALSGETGVDADRAHMAALCRMIGAPEPGPTARWCVVDAGAWRLRWERHTEFSTWTFFRPALDDGAALFQATAVDLAPQSWVADLPGDVLVACHVALVREIPAEALLSAESHIGAIVADGAARVLTDFRAGPDGCTRVIIASPHGDAALNGRIVQQVFELETYRLMALFAFPLAQETAAKLAGIEAEAARSALRVTEEGGAAEDRKLLTHLAALAGEAEAIAARTSFRFAAARAYHGLVRERIAQLREVRLDERPTIGEFMERRLAPAMRTCEAVEQRQIAVSERIARTAQMLNTRVDIAAEEMNAELLASMDRRALLQLRLQETVEGLSVAAISYYALGLLGYILKAAAHVMPNIDPNVATGLAAPLVIGLVWYGLRLLRERAAAETDMQRPPPP
ncbi:MAG: DUF3422 family protein [Alphaproteobacteria bacterium]|nr:DUF3422 family protein [Alphaproteobacteria bacterium]